MKVFFIAFLLVGLTTIGFAQDFPAKPTKLVSDFTGTLSAGQVQNLENKLVAYDDSTSIQIAVAIVKSVGEYDINEYALELGRKWGVGSKKNTGVMIVVALNDRKLAIQTGYGIEGALPDISTKSIIENDIKPSFKQGDYYTGLDLGINSIIKLTKGEYKNDAPKAKKAKGGGMSSIVVLLVIVVIIIIIIRKGGGGGGSQVIGGRGVANALFWSMLFSGGRGSGGSGFGGGFGGGGGSSGGGGFGGFGGGSFGGGGSSGSW
jgi:uncharacterized protein